MKKRLIAILLSFSVVLGLTGCGSEPREISREGVESEEEPGEDGNRDVDLKINYDEPDEEHPEIVEKSILKRGINQFGFGVYDRLSKEENCFFSPYSLCSALSLLDLGAGSSTKEELESTLGIEDLDAWKWAMKDYLEKEWSKDTYLLTANSVWMDENKEWSGNIEEDFIAPAKAYFKGELKKKNFKEQDKVVSEVNEWVKDNTKGMIPQVLNKLSDDTKMLLINAVYFDGKWETPFLEEDSRDDVFHGAKGDETVKMMNQYGESYAYVSMDGIKGITLPYKDSSVVMKVFIPENEEDNIADLMGALSNEERQNLIDSLDRAGRTEIRRLMFPRFEYEQEIKEMDRILKDMGIVSAYQENADLDKIAEDLFVSTVIHKAKIEVDEQGTKAAAVTVIVANETACIQEPVFIDFIVDRPFFFVIEDTETGVILFMGQINTLEN